LTRSTLIRRLVATGGAAGLTVQQAVGAQPDVDLRLAENTVFLAPAVRFRLLAICAHDLAGRLGGHSASVVRAGLLENVTEVIGKGKSQKSKVKSQKSNCRSKTLLLGYLDLLLQFDS
jgi:hypothetical protein